LSINPEGTPSTSAPEPTTAQRYPHLGTKGISVSSSASADISIRPSRREGWMVTGGLLVAGCISMGIYLVVLHH